MFVVCRGAGARPARAAQQIWRHLVATPSKSEHSPQLPGPGYGVYFTRRGDVVYLLFLGGNKSSQKRDIKRASEMARAIEKEQS